jgi:DNA-binding response OmpR family regulator
LYDDGRLTIDYDDVRAACQGAAVKLTNKEFSLLSALAKKRGRVITRQQLLIKYGDTVITVTHGH